MNVSACELCPDSLHLTPTLNGISEVIFGLKELEVQGLHLFLQQCALIGSSRRGLF